MSYCRWSSMDWQCDVYVWGDCDGGIRIEVAGRRRVVTVPLPPPVPAPGPTVEDHTRWAAATVRRDQEVDKILAKMEWKKLPTPSMGDSILAADEGEAARILRELRSEGFNVPDYAIEALEEEAKEANDG